MTIPLVGHVVVLGYLATVAISAIENAVLVGGLSALGAAIYSIGVPKDSVLQYKTALKADNFLVMAHGSSEEAVRAKAILGAANSSRVDIYAGMKVPDLAPGDMFAKQLTFIAGAEPAGLMLGAREPIILTSRADSARTRLASCVLRVLMAQAGGAA